MTEEQEMLFKLMNQVSDILERLMLQSQINEEFRVVIKELREKIK